MNNLKARNEKKRLRRIYTNQIRHNVEEPYPIIFQPELDSKLLLFYIETP